MPKVCPVCGNHYPDSSVFCPTDGSSLRAADAAGDLIGSVIADRYLVTDLLGEGGMGKVFLAQHVRLPLQAAIKVLRPELLKDPSSVARFNREAANAASIEHERVARVFDFGETGDGLVYLAMEYVNGTTLKKLLADGPLDLERSVRIIRQVADGLDAAHRMGIVHRDLKPDNILVHVGPDGEYSCKVVDFGIAKAVGAGNNEAALTRTGFVVGTPEFMSPEQLLAGDLDARSDVYALALTAFHCLTLELPFESKGPDHGLTARLVSAPRSLSEVRPDKRWPRALEAAFEHALQRDPEQRTASAGDFARALEAAVFATESAETLVSGSSAATVESTSALTPASTPVAATVATHSPTVATAGSVASSPREAVVSAAPRASALLRIVVPTASLLMLGAAGSWWYATRSVSSDVDSAVTAPASSDPVPDVGSTNDVVVGTPDSMDRSQDSGISAAGTGTNTGAGSPVPVNTGGGPAVPTPTSPRATSRPSPSPANAGARTVTLQSLKNSLDPQTATARDAQVVINGIPGVLAGLRSASDSAEAYILAAEAHLLLEDVQAACAALDAARMMARTPVQAEKINVYSTNLPCRSSTW